MKKGVLSGLARMKRLQVTAAQTANELLEMRYIETAEQTLRGAAIMKKVLHEEDRDISKAKSAISSRPSAKKKPKRNISKRATRKVTGRKSGKR